MMLASSTIRPCAVAGLFYPDDAQRLLETIASHLAHAQLHAIAPCALLVPHAGYIYSADIAASAYRQISEKPIFTRVLLLGPAHRVGFSGCALPTVSAFHTPLGDIRIDTSMRDQAIKLAGVRLDDRPHQEEHSLEVQLPFLQIVLPQCSVLPVLIGDARCDDVVALIERLWDQSTLLIISSDLSHYAPYAQAQQHDAITLQRISQFDAELGGNDACGCKALNPFLIVARRRGLITHILDARNSGDTAGEHTRVVGYAAVAWTQPEAPAQIKVDHQQQLGTALLQLARTSIATALGIASRAEIAHLPELQQQGSTFVTLERHGQLRGCIGSIGGTRILRDDVCHNAKAAASQDWRFAPLTAAEWPGLSIEVSLLSTPTPFPVESEQDACDQLVPLRDGLILQYGQHHATFLPQVWESLPNPHDFLAQLKLKAGLAAHFWSSEIRLQRYQVQHWHEVNPDD